MRRSTLNLVFAVIIALGGAQLATPSPVVADDLEACCISPDAGGCCGDECRIVGNKCESCEGFLRCLFF